MAPDAEVSGPSVLLAGGSGHRRIFVPLIGPGHVDRLSLAVPAPHSKRAERFYTRYGFAEVGHCIFRLGDRVDDDRIWRRPL